MKCSALLAILLPLGLAAESPEPVPSFHLQEIEGRHYFVDENGTPFRALGINHLESATGSPEEILGQLRDWGFNAGGSNTPEWLAAEMPHPQAHNLLRVSRWMGRTRTFKFEDVFDPEFQENLRLKTKEVCLKKRGNPLFLGYYWSDIPLWSGQTADQPTWIEFLKSLPVSAPGRHAWQSWRQAHPDAPQEDFLGEIAAVLYGTAYRAFKEFDTDRLILGDKYLESDMPEVVVRAALPYIDVISIQPSSRDFDPDYIDRLYTRYGKPIYISDHVAGFATREYSRTITPWTWPTAEEYAAYYSHYVQAALSHPRIIGYTRCQFQSVPRSGVPDTKKQGLLTVDGKPYSIVEAIGDANRAALKLALPAKP